MKAGVVDYRMGNLASVAKALERVGAEACVSDEPGVLDRCDALVLPGVGNFAAGMAHLRELRLDDVVRGWIGGGRPLLGICLGMQMLFEHSEEGDSEGLGLLDGQVARLSSLQKVPHMGWNEIEGGGFFGAFSGRKFYFVHSYVCIPDPEAPMEAAVTIHGETEFTSGVVSDGIIALQFHPEKSGDDGLALLRAALEVLA